MKELGNGNPPLNEFLSPSGTFSSDRNTNFEEEVKNTFDLLPLGFQEYFSNEQSTKMQKEIVIKLPFRLSFDVRHIVKAKIAERPETPLAILEKLVVDADSYVRAAVVNNPKISLGILEKLAVDEIGHVRQAVAENPQIYVNSTIEMLVEK